MNRRTIALAAVAAGLTAAAAAPEQAASSTGPTPHPADARAPSAPLRHESALTGYRPMADVKPAPWKGTNETVEALGGHVGHLKALETARSGAAPKPAEPAPKPAEPPRGHRH